MLCERLPLVFIAPPLPFVYDASVAAVGEEGGGWSGRARGGEAVETGKWRGGLFEMLFRVASNLYLGEVLVPYEVLTFRRFTGTAGRRRRPC